jgi:hypothetical protein
MIRYAQTIVVLLVCLITVGCSLDRTAGTATGSGNARTVAVTGFVRDAASRPVAHASVDLYKTRGFPGRGDGSYRTSTDDSGRYVFPEVEHGTYHLLATNRDSTLAAFQTEITVHVDSGDKTISEMKVYPSGRLAITLDTNLTDFDSLDAYLCGTAYRQRMYDHHSFYFGNVVAGDYKLVVILRPEPTGSFVHSGICVVESLTVSGGETTSLGMLDCNRPVEPSGEFLIDDFDRIGTRWKGHTDWKVWTHFTDTFDTQRNSVAIVDHTGAENRMFKPGADGTGHSIHVKYQYEDVGSIRNHVIRTPFGAAGACEGLNAGRYWNLSAAESISFFVKASGTPATVSLSLWSPFSDYGIVLAREGVVPEEWTPVTFDLTGTPPSGTHVKLPRWQDQMNYARTVEVVIKPHPNVKEGTWSGEFWVDEISVQF